MKKVLSLMLVLCLLCGGAALAGEDLTGRPIADGVVAAAAYTDITAPFSGTLATFDLESGDAVEAEQTLFTFVENGLYATEDGTVKAVFIQPGDDAAAVASRYGAVIGMEPAVEYQVEGTTADAYDENENRLIHLGETLYFTTADKDGDEGSGRVVAISGETFRVDVLEGTFELDASVTLYRDDDYNNKTKVGKGTVSRRDPLLYTASGRVSAVAVSEGDTVRTGDLLASFVSADADPENSEGTVETPVSGVVETVAVNPGQQVWKSEWLCRVDDTDTLEAVVDVDEVDLGTLAVGDKLPVTLDMDEETVLTGTVTQISALGVTRQNAAYFTVHVSLPAGSAPLGASASVYLPAKGE